MARTRSQVFFRDHDPLHHGHDHHRHDHDRHLHPEDLRRRAGDDRRPVRHRRDRHAVLPPVLHQPELRLWLGHRHRAADRRRPGHDLQPAPVPRSGRRSDGRQPSAKRSKRTQRRRWSTASWSCWCIVWTDPDHRLLHLVLPHPRGHRRPRAGGRSSRTANGGRSRTIDVPRRPGPQRRHDDSKGVDRHLRGVPRRASTTPDGKRVDLDRQQAPGQDRGPGTGVDRQHRTSRWTTTRQVLAGKTVRDHSMPTARWRSCAGRQHVRRLPQQPGRGHPVDRHPDPDRRLRRLRLRLDELPRPRARSSSWSWRCWWCRCRSPWCRSCSDYVKLGPERHLPGASGWRTPASACRWPPTCSTTTSAACRATSSSRPSSTAPRTSPSSRS